jgi:hypothetical protein
VSKEDSGVLMEESIHLDPGLLFGVNLLALHADGDYGSELEDSRDGLDDQQSAFLSGIRQGAGGDERLQFSHLQAVGKLEIHYAMADALPLQGKPHGIANHAALAFRSTTATFGNIEGMEAAEDFASPELIDHVERLSAELGGGVVEVENPEVAIDHESGHGNCVEDCSIRQLARRRSHKGTSDSRRKLA